MQRPRRKPKKKTPDQQTLAYEYYMLKQMREKVVKLVNGAELYRTITWYDRYVIKLEREPEAPNLVIQKQAINYCYKQ